MPNSTEIEAAVLRQLALQHIEAGKRISDWGQPPTDWLETFIPTYGTIAAPVHQALTEYYDARHRAAEALANEHFRTADQLRDAADTYEATDDENGRNILRAGGLLDDPNTHPAPVPVGGHTPPDQPATQVTPPPGGPPPGGPPSGPTSAGPDGTGVTPTTTQPNGPVTGGPSVPHAPSEIPGATAPNTQHAAPTGASGSSGASAPSSSMPGMTPPPVTTPPSVSATPPPIQVASDERAPSAQPAGASGGADAMPMATPFAAAVAAAKNKQAEPAYVVGNAENDDLVLARTLLASVLAAVESPVGMSWAVSVMRGPGGAGVFITSNEGRGWLPPRLFLPREVSSPWLWDELLGADTEGAASPWEGVSDPARILAEFGLAWGAKANAQLSALVSSGPIDSGLRSRFSDVAMEGLVGPTYDVDLREFTPDTADRLGLTGSITALEHVSALPDSQVRARTVELASDAHAQVGRSVQPSAHTVESRQLRERILAKVQAGEAVSRQMWDELRDADDLLSASMLSQRVDVGRVEFGQLRVDTEVSALRTMVFERRCNELVLLLAQESDRQSLRDAVYAHEQIVEHPQFVAAPSAVTTAAPERVDRPAVSTVSAPDIAGPPAGAMVAPTSPPGAGPDVTPNRS
ncbi:type VII secretion target [Nocardia australiensis]|uniref:type VII secretion target n=1 Tax=Nocardia australiensis TaxID=2887191 RepID=UPI001D132A48|nr:type VII secretion target [Nocardia australiensis]